MRKWQRNGSPLPLPDLCKQEVVIEYIKRFSREIFIETGTHKGRMVYAVQPYVKNIYSIELDETHYLYAKRRFAGYPNIRILQGQSGEVLPEVLKDVNEPCLFWLDAHYSGGSTAKGELETPIMQELQCILGHQVAERHVVLIDDARCFVGRSDYPLLDELREFVLGICPGWVFTVKDDIIRMHSSKPSR